MLKPFAPVHGSLVTGLAPLLALGLLLLPAAIPAQTPADTATKPAPMQLPADQKAYRDARDTKDPDAKIAALQQFFKDFPDSKRIGAAHELLFNTLLDAHPGQTRKIEKQAHYMIDHADSGSVRAYQEYNVASQLSQAGSKGVDLKAAERWGNAAVEGNTEAIFTADTKAIYAKDKLPEPSSEELRRQWQQYQAGYMQVLAEVYYNEDKLDQATAILDQAHALNPTDGSVYLTRGQIAIAHHHDADALEDLELAEIYGGLNGTTAPLLSKLYAEAHGGSTASLDSEIDARYKQLSPPPFKPTSHTAPPTGRTVLMELFTGSGCHPCVAADLAMDGVLAAYPRSEVVALSYDEHIPQPDPLANADSVARGQFYKISGTPTGFLDGQQIPELGGDRESSGKNYQGLTAQLDKQLDTPSGVELDLQATFTPSHTIEAHANVSIAHPEAMKKALTAAPAKEAGATPATPTTPTTSPVSEAALEPTKLIVNCALVQQTVRYSGENGIRFHSMVVRALAKPSAEGLPIISTGTSSVPCSFDPAAISHSLGEYLAAFAKHSDRFGETKFISTDTTLPLDDLGVVAWVEDPATHHILQSAFVPLGKPELKAAR